MAKGADIVKVSLMYRDEDFDCHETPSSQTSLLTQDLELSTLWNAMARGDKLLREAAQRAVLSPLTDLDAIRYRQNVLKDCLNNPSIVRTLYQIAEDAIQEEKQHYFGLFRDSPGVILNRSVKVMALFLDWLAGLKRIADDSASRFESQGFKRFFNMLTQELSDDYFSQARQHLRELEFRDGIWVSASLGKGNRGTDYLLHRHPRKSKPRWIQRILTKEPPFYTVVVADRDESGARALSALEDRGTNRVANALAQSVDHVLSFFIRLRTELAFYLGCLNVHQQLTDKGEPLCFPDPVAPDERRHAFEGLYDICLALSMTERAVGNAIQAHNKDLILITGANQGGKSTFLRSIGLAQLMMQSGMFVAAESFSANIADGLFTHFRREEDETMNSGKLDEELHRMSNMVDDLRASSLVLFNESFAATNEREGSEIARQIIQALLEKHIKVFFVTHLFDLARGFHHKGLENVLFLRAQRLSDGTRTFKLVEGEPLQTSYGEDLYRQIFGPDGPEIGNRLNAQGP